MSYNEVSAHLNVYLKLKPNETPEEADERMKVLLYKLEENEGVAIQIYDIYLQEV